MRLRPKSDFWQVGVVHAAARDLLSSADWTNLRDKITWMPEPGPWRYLADPFAVRRGDTLHVFVEAFDYRSKHAVIEHHALEANLRWREAKTVLSGPHHLSYPFIIEQEKDVFMVPESHKAGEIALYRARSFPDDWVRETALLQNVAGAEPSLIFFEGTWWMFFTIVGPAARDQRELHIAFADRLTGPWTAHPGKPVIVDRSGARPGGTPFVNARGLVVLPVQNCSRTYGGSLRFLQFDRLAKTNIRWRHLELELTGALVHPGYPDGMHTFSSCGDVTLIDVKRVSRSFGRHIVDWRRRFRTLGRS